MLERISHQDFTVLRQRGGTSSQGCQAVPLSCLKECPHYKAARTGVSRTHHPLMSWINENEKQAINGEKNTQGATRSSLKQKHKLDNCSECIHRLRNREARHGENSWIRVLHPSSGCGTEERPLQWKCVSAFGGGAAKTARVPTRGPNPVD